MVGGNSILRREPSVSLSFHGIDFEQVQLLFCSCRHLSIIIYIFLLYTLTVIGATIKTRSMPIRMVIDALEVNCPWFAKSLKAVTK